MRYQLMVIKKNPTDVTHMSDNSISRLVELFTKNYLSPCTKLAYSKDIEQFLMFCKEQGYSFKHPKEITSDHFRAYRDWLMNERQLQSNSVLRKMVSMRALMTWCFHEGLIDRNPLLNVQLPKGKQISSTSAFTDEEVRIILALPKKDTLSGALHYAVLVMLFYLGLRKSELINIRIKDFSDERNHLTLTLHGKGDKYRKVPITPFIKTVVEEYKIKCLKSFTQDSFLFQPIRNNFSKTTEKQLHTSTINYFIWFYTSKAEIDKNVSPHSCRATIITHLLDNKIPIRDIANFVGHSSIQTTSIYDKNKNDLDKSPAYKVQY